jgi:uncharacterized protein involved in exopolysaccharide biosynthesis
LATLVVVRGVASGKVFPLNQSESIIGRSREADVSIVERAISSQHALVRRVNDGHEIVDLGSTNGTLLNGRRLAPNSPVELHPGDVLQLGECALVYLAEGMKDVGDVTQALSVAAPNLALAGASMGGPDEILAQILKLSAPPEPPPKVSIDERVEQVSRLLQRLKRHVPLVSTVAAIGALLAIASVAIIPPLAEAMFTIALRPQASDNPLERNGQNSEDSYSFFLSAESNFGAKKIVAESLRKQGVAKPSDGLIESVQRRLSFKSIALSTYAGSYKHQSPDEAAKFLRTHVETYLETEIAKTLKVVQKQVDFLTSQSKEQEIQLRETEAKLKEFRTKYGEMLPENSEGHMESLETLRQRQSDLSARVEAANAAHQAAISALRQMAPVATIRTTSAAPYRTALNEAKVQLAAAKSRGLGDSHPDVIRYTKQVAEYTTLVNKALAEDASATETAGNTEVIALQRAVAERHVEVLAAKAEAGAVGSQIARLEEIVTKLPGVAAEYAQLTRSYGVNTETHRRLLEQLDNATVRLNLERASAEKRYEVLTEPVAHAPNVRRTLLLRAVIGAAAGAVVGVLIAAFIWIRRWLRELPQRRAQAIAGHAPGHHIVPVGPNLPTVRRN